MAETPSQSPPPPSRSVSETETVTEEAPQEYWCYHCDKRVSVETVANLPDIVCHDCKNGFVESIPRTDPPPPSQPSDQANDPYGSPFLQVLRLIAQAARDEDAPPPPPQNPPTSEEDFLRIELDGWDNDEDEDEDAHSVEFHNGGGVENEEAEVEEEDEEDRSDREEDENEERDEEDLRRRRRDVLRLRIRDFATRARSGRNQILDWAEILMGLEDNSIELRFEMPESDRYVGNPEDYVDAAGYEALLQTLAESDGSGRRGAPPASKAAVSQLQAVDEAGVCAICKDMVNVDEMSKKLPCGHGYHGDCIVPWLSSRNSCPVCRFELPTDDPEYEEERKKHAVNVSAGASGSGGANSVSG
ncbi:PREDICTED: E3 ubiquitin-protein ligase CIP8-like [Fragaria vesca subsp. vesca]|uniref:E3 ubiquitin-protein ligase CIP8 n=1 Tax=Fragaria vesca subsp. vesca TaxID=101020 RepID=UPI0002C2F061|nr:PREDICTED: E3 ubiquitin-protein ligase CIP8 [Fragaria vesca subsp. vesca]